VRYSDSGIGKLLEIFESRTYLRGFELLDEYLSITGEAFVPSRPRTKLVAEPADVHLVE